MISELIRDDLKDILPYETAKLVAEVPYIRLHANESPWSLSEKNLNRYPKLVCRDIPALYFRVKPEELIITRGSNEGIDVLVRLFCKAGRDEILIITPTFGMYKIAAQIQGIKINTAELIEKEEFKFNVDNIIQGITKKSKIVFICSPNNPTGNSISNNDIEKICAYCRGKSIVVIDEAYFEFSEGKSATSLINQYDNLVIIRTLSKAFGLAGVRAGFILANEKMIRTFQLIQQPYSIPTPCIELIENAMSNEKIVQMWINTTVIKSSRKYLINIFKELDIFEKVYSSEANFILVKLKSAGELEKFASEQGVLLRKIGNSDNYLRISVGTYEQNEELINILKKWGVNREK